MTLQPAQSYYMDLSTVSPMHHATLTANSQLWITIIALTSCSISTVHSTCLLTAKQTDHHSSLHSATKQHIHYCLMAWPTSVNAGIHRPNYSTPLGKVMHYERVYMHYALWFIFQPVTWVENHKNASHRSASSYSARAFCPQTFHQLYLRQTKSLSPQSQELCMHSCTYALTQWPFSRFLYRWIFFLSPAGTWLDATYPIFIHPLTHSLQNEGMSLHLRLMPKADITRTAEHKQCTNTLSPICCASARMSKSRKSFPLCSRQVRSSSVNSLFHHWSTWRLDTTSSLDSTPPDTHTATFAFILIYFFIDEEASHYVNARGLIFFHSPPVDNIWEMTRGQIMIIRTVLCCAVVVHSHKHT